MAPAHAHSGYPALRPYQQRLADILSQSEGSQLLPFFQGFGKVQTLTVAAESYIGDLIGPNLAAGKGPRILVATAKPQVNHWLQEIDRIGWLPARPHRQGSIPGQATTVVASFTELSQNADLYLAHPWQLVVVDEAPKPLSAPTPTRRQQVLRQLVAERTCWVVSRYNDLAETQATRYLRDLVLLFDEVPHIAKPGALLRPSGLAERLGAS